MPDFSLLLIPASVAFGTVSEDSVYKIIFGLGLAFLAPLLNPVAYLFGQLLGKLSGASIIKPLFYALPNQTLKNIYVAGTVGYFLIVNLLGKIPLLQPVIDLVGGINSVVAGVLAAIFGILADILGPKAMPPVME